MSAPQRHAAINGQGAGEPEADLGGFAKLSNRLITCGILAHLLADALKVYQAILHAARERTRSCYPTVETLSRWSGVPKNRISRLTKYLEGHGLIRREWMRIRGNPNPRRRYWLVSPSMFPDLRISCSYCMSTGPRKPCKPRDTATGRFRARDTAPRAPGNTVGRNPSMSTVERNTKQTDADEKVLSRRGGEECREGEPDGDARSASPRRAASLASPGLEAEPGGEPKAALKGQDLTATRRAALALWLKTGLGDMAERVRYAKKANHSEAEIEAALREISQEAGCEREA